MSYHITDSAFGVKGCQNRNAAYRSLYASLPNELEPLKSGVYDDEFF